MAMVNLPPHEAARRNRQRTLNAMLQSPDGFTRYMAKETLLNDATADYGKALVKQGYAVAREKERIEREAERGTEQFYKDRYPPFKP